MDLEKNNIDRLFERLNGQFNTEEPQEGHQARFLSKLNSAPKSTASAEIKVRKINWFKSLSIAASIAVLISLGLGFFFNKTSAIADVSPEAEKAQFYFTALIEKEVEKINAEVTPETKQLVDDAMKQLNKLELDYQQLEQELLNNGNASQILYAMITNFQTRIDLLQEVLQKIDRVKQLKENQNENYVI